MNNNILAMNAGRIGAEDVGALEVNVMLNFGNTVVAAKTNSNAQVVIMT